MSLKISGTAPPVRRYLEPRLETELVCDACKLRYAIYGIFAFCPDCGNHNSLQMLLTNLEFVRKMLSLAGAADGELRERLVHDALENAVSAFDGFGREVCRVGLEKTALTTAWSPSFQNLGAAREAVLRTFGFDLHDGVADGDWSFLIAAFQKRHLIAHKMGVIDQKYVNVTHDSTAVVGRKVAVASTEVERTCELLSLLGARLSTRLTT